MCGYGKSKYFYNLLSLIGSLIKHSFDHFMSVCCTHTDEISILGANKSILSTPNMSEI